LQQRNQEKNEAAIISGLTPMRENPVLSGNVFDKNQE
jgi:hypothetical protein